MHGPSPRPRKSCRVVLVSAFVLSLVGPGSTAARAQSADPLSDPGAAVGLALRDLGYTAGSVSPSIPWISRHGPDLVYMTVRDDPQVLSDQGRFRQALREHVDATLQGRSRFGGWRSAQLQLWAESIRNADPTTDPGRASLSARLRWDDGLSRGIYLTSLYGGVPPVFRGPLEATVNAACAEYRDRWTGRSPQVFANCLEYLLDGTPAGY
jgi:hypothetical protein